MVAFTRAKRQQIKLRMALDGPSGSGKTYTALTLATVFAGGEPFAVIDSEHGSSDRYADLFTFDRLNLEAPYSPERYIEAIKAAQAEGYPVLVIDSITHEWNGAGGVLAEVDRIARVKYRDNKFQAWGDVTPRHNAFIEAMIGSGLHVLVTIRSKTGHAVETDDKGRITGVKKMGMEAQQRDGVEYEFDLVGDLDIGNTLSITKSRAVSLAGQVIARPGEALGRQLLAWTATGERAPKPAPAPEAPPAPAPTPLPARPAPKPAAAVSVTSPTHGPATAEQLAEIEYLTEVTGQQVPHIKTHIQAELTIKSLKARAERDKREAEAAAARTPADALEGLPTMSPAV